MLQVPTARDAASTPDENPATDNHRTAQHHAHHTRSTCRACGGRHLTPFLSLGPTPLANSFPRTPDEFEHEASFPLVVSFCETCSLVQLLDVIAAEVLFRNYIYVTGTSSTMSAHNVGYARDVAGLLDLRPDDLVIEVASNDGSLLTCFRTHGVRTLGIEPAANIAKVARERGIETIDWFLSQSSAQQIRQAHGTARAVIANNVLAHVDDTLDFLRGCRDLLSEDGRLIVEVPYLQDLVDRLEYDTIYHEHLSYFSVSTLMRLYETAGLSITRVDRVPVHGGSLRVHAARRERHAAHGADVIALAGQERSSGLTSLARLQAFADGVARSRRTLLELLHTLKAQGKTVAAYGAPAKGNTLLNYCGIDTSLVAYTVDRNPLKVGLFTPGMHLPVLPVAAIEERQPDYVLILAWNFAEEIMAQLHVYRSRGGRFILPIPQATVV